jgi:hypothetical protein
MQPEYAVFLRGIPQEIISKATGTGLTLIDHLDAGALSPLLTRLVLNAREANLRAEVFNFWLGDLLVYGGSKFRGRSAGMARKAGLHPTTLRIAKLVCSRIPVLCRRNGLSWSHHCEIAKKCGSGEEIGRWLKTAFDEKLSCSELRERIAASRRNPDGAQNASQSLEFVPFAIVRELLAAEGLVQREQSTWRAWPPDKCRSVLNELPTLVRFFEALQNRACSEDLAVTAS